MTGPKLFWPTLIHVTSDNSILVELDDNSRPNSPWSNGRLSEQMNRPHFMWPVLQEPQFNAEGQMNTSSWIRFRLVHARQLFTALVLGLTLIGIQGCGGSQKSAPESPSPTVQSPTPTGQAAQRCSDSQADTGSRQRRRSCAWRRCTDRQFDSDLVGGQHRRTQASGANTNQR